MFACFKKVIGQNTSQNKTKPKRKQRKTQRDGANTFVRNVEQKNCLTCHHSILRFKQTNMFSQKQNPGFHKSSQIVVLFLLH